VLVDVLTTNKVAAVRGATLYTNPGNGHVNYF